MKPIRSGFCVTGFQIATFDTWIGISFVTMPPGWFFIGLGFAVLLHLVYAVDDDVRVVDDAGDVTTLALVAARDDDDVVTLLDLAHV